MILSRKPLSIAEVKVYIKDLDGKKPIIDYTKNFESLSKQDAEKLSKEIQALNNPKIKDEHIVKIVDFLPKDSEDINKIFIDVSLTEEESNAILNLVKNY